MVINVLLWLQTRAKWNLEAFYDKAAYIKESLTYTCLTVRAWNVPADQVQRTAPFERRGEEVSWWRGATKWTRRFSWQPWQLWIHQWQGATRHRKERSRQWRRDGFAQPLKAPLRCLLPSRLSGLFCVAMVTWPWLELMLTVICKSCLLGMVINNCDDIFSLRRQSCARRERARNSYLWVCDFWEAVWAWQTCASRERVNSEKQYGHGNRDWNCVSIVLSWINLCYFNGFLTRMKNVRLCNDQC